MNDRLEDDLMEDLMAEPEGRSGHAADEFDEADEFEEADEYDAGDELDELEAADDLGEEAWDSAEAEESIDELEEAVADSLEAEDADEFFGGFKNILKTVGKVARKVAPIAKMIPIPQAQLIGGAADMIGNVLADEGDELDAMDGLADYADEGEALDAFAPAIAGLAIRGALKHRSAAIPRAPRVQLVKTVSAATRHLARKHGPQAVAALPGIVRHARNVLVKRGLPARHLPHLVKRAAQQAIRSPRALRKFVRVGARLRTAAPGLARRARGLRGWRGTRPGVAGFGGGGLGRVAGARPVVSGSTRFGGAPAAWRAGGASASYSGYCAHCRRRTFRLSGPVTVTIRSM